MKNIFFIICLLLNIYLSSESFQLSFFKEINKENINKNLTISPLSAYQVLGLTANGAKGKTLDEMLLALENNDLEELNQINKDILDISKQFTTIEMANAVMTKLRPKQGFMDAAQLYEATVEALKNVEQVNSWCNLKTHGTIPTIIDTLPPNTLMVLLNAVYFKGQWKVEFDEKNTTKKLFYNYGDKSNAVNVDTMKSSEEYNYYEDKELQIIELPYTKDSMSAVIILPNEETDINDFISELTDEKLQKLLKRMYPERVDLEMPKFKTEFSAELNDVLQNMGMVIPFKAYADFTNMLDGSVYIDKVIQKTFLSVDEKGTEAAGATIVVIRKNGPPKIYKMSVNRPFLFMLRNKSLPQNYEMMFISKIEQL
jgi:serpin B